MNHKNKLLKQELKVEIDSLHASIDVLKNIHLFIEASKCGKNSYTFISLKNKGLQIKTNDFQKYLVKIDNFLLCEPDVEHLLAINNKLIEIEKTFNEINKYIKEYSCDN